MEEVASTGNWEVVSGIRISEQSGEDDAAKPKLEAAFRTSDAFRAGISVVDWRALWQSKSGVAAKKLRGELKVRRERLFFQRCVSLVVLTVSILVTCVGVSAQESVLVNFDFNDGWEPIAGLVMDAAGNLYGTTFYGGAYGSGTVFELSPRANGWSETVLYSFNDVGSDGFWPNSKLVFDAAGNLYGTTFFGGYFQVGTVFELSPVTGGGWTETTIHAFDPKNEDGKYPHAGLIVDAAGNLYGTAAGGGHSGDGVVYELTASASGNWTEKILHSFSGSDGASPYSSVVFDAFGDLYGATAYGGTSSACTGGCGTVFELVPTSAGNWMEKTLSFDNSDGANPYGGLILDAAGNIYGVTSQGGVGNTGLVFELVPAGGGWNERILHLFAAHEGDAYNGWGPLVFDAAGNLYGSTSVGGAFGKGAVYELTPAGSGEWSESLLYNFDSGAGNIYNPAPGLVIDSAGNLYGAALSGGNYLQACLGGCGAVFEITR
jgi:uncharacterized repeat protein (TIGR03803 family)